jgi:hypothetical protein
MIAAKLRHTFAIRLASCRELTGDPAKGQIRRLLSENKESDIYFLVTFCLRTKEELLL